MPATNQWAVSTLIREVLADPDLAHDEVFRRLPPGRVAGPGRRRGPRGNCHHTKRRTPPARVEQGREERARAKLGDRELELAGGGGHRLEALAVAAVGALWRARRGAARRSRRRPQTPTRPARPGPEQTPEDARPARSGSARTSRISVDTAHW